MDQQPVQIGQYVLGKNLGIGAFGKVKSSSENLLSSSKFCCNRSDASLRVLTMKKGERHGFRFI